MDSDGGLVSARFDFNNEMGGGTSYKDMFNDGVISDRTWGKYLEKVYRISNEQPIQQLQQRGAPMDLAVDEDGELLLPEETKWPSDLTGEGAIKWQKWLLRSFLGSHYGKSCFHFIKKVLTNPKPWLQRMQPTGVPGLIF